MYILLLQITWLSLLLLLSIIVVVVVVIILFCFYNSPCSCYYCGFCCCCYCYDVCKLRRKIIMTGNTKTIKKRKKQKPYCNFSPPPFFHLSRLFSRLFHSLADFRPNIDFHLSYPQAVSATAPATTPPTRDCFRVCRNSDVALYHFSLP